MSLPEHYLITVALHATVLSAAVFLAIVFLRKPQRIAVTALCGTLAVAILPWISAMRSQRALAPDETGSSPVSAMTSLPQWTVIHIPIEEGTRPAPPVPVTSTTPTRFALPKTSPVATIWVLGGLVSLASLAIASMNVLRWRQRLTEMDDAAWQAILHPSLELPPRRCFRISPAACSPCVVGFIKPIVVIPSFLLDDAKRRELHWALRHELRHWHGSDSRWTMLLECIRLTQWWNPFLHLLIARWKVAREFICDLAASDEDRTGYGEFLIQMASTPSSRNPLAVTMIRRQRLKTLKTRIVAVLKAAPGSAAPFEKSILLSACLSMLAAALMISCVQVGDRKTTLTAPSVKVHVAESAEPPAHPAEIIESKDEPKANDTGVPGVAATIKLQTKIIFTSERMAENESIRSDAEMQLLMRNLAQKKGSILITAPSAAVKSNETAMIEIIREHPADPPRKADLRDRSPRATRYAGWSMRTTQVYDGEKIDFTANIGYGFVPGAHYSPHSNALSMLDEDNNIDWSKLVQKNMTAHARLGVDETLAIDLGEVEPGAFGTVFMTINPIDRRGLVIASFKESLQPIPIPVEGKLMLCGTVAERDTFPDFDFDYEVDSPMYAFSISKKDWERVKKTMELEDGPTVEVGKEKPAILAGEDQVMFSGEWVQNDSGGTIQPRLACWIKRGGTTVGPTIPYSLEASPDQVEIFRLRPTKQGMTRLLFVEVKPAKE